MHGIGQSGMKQGVSNLRKLHFDQQIMVLLVIANLTRQLIEIMPGLPFLSLTRSGATSFRKYTYALEPFAVQPEFVEIFRFAAPFICTHILLPLL